MKIYIDSKDIHELEWKHKENSIKILKALNELTKIDAVEVIIKTDEADRTFEINDSLHYRY